jgi:hypothetical protein
MSAKAIRATVNDCSHNPDIFAPNYVASVVFEGDVLITFPWNKTLLQEKDFLGKTEEEIDLMLNPLDPF